MTLVTRSFMKLLIDADILVYRSTAAVEKDCCFEERYHILMSDQTAAWSVVEDTLYELMDIALTSDVQMIFSDPKNNFRKHLAGSYKSNRKGTRKPLAYWHIVERLKEEHEHLTLDNIEADDTLGLIATKYPNESIIWSIDKDLMQIPGYHLVDDEIIEVSQIEGDRFFWEQTLSGDPVDGYKGCPGIGSVRAKRMVAEFDNDLDAWDAIVATYKKAGSTEALALYNARMARILRHGEYNNGEVKLWTPNQ